MPAVASYCVFPVTQGRTRQVKTSFQRRDLATGIRNCYQQGKAGKCGIPGDEGGHLIGTYLGGPGERINLVPQNMNLNRGEWREMENEWAKAGAEGKTVEFKIDVICEPRTQRPMSFSVQYATDGIPKDPRTFLNQPGGRKP